MGKSGTALLASSISAVVAMAVVWLQYSLERRRQQRADRAERLAGFFAASHALVLHLGNLARAPLDEKDQIEVKARDLEDRINSRLAQVQLLEDRDIVDVARRLDGQLVHLARQARTKQWPRDDWREARADLSLVVSAYQSAARRKLGAEKL
ncbi:hypothetical protein LADH09A_000911 [Micromonospora sp. LAH09]|uniref:hypothetical protein n=1 Tax=Micromonospora cabrerizensis TaxID=2911213 RepID=UPI001EE8441B|nr:hypothetical protein [Micromonospora cabrerizensis]MCG5473027.1 hypothetical protein [Micromonospora cabrerizensis]